jgi:hypothetical protein
MFVATGTTSLSTPVTSALIAGGFAVLLAVLKAIGWLVSAPRDRRRDLYGRAYQDAMAWLEMLYRIRRRPQDGSGDRELIGRFHELQERIDYHRGWLGSESRFLAHSYCRLVEAIKHQCEPLIVQAWASAPRAPGTPAPEGEQHASVEAESLRFLSDVRMQLSYWPLLPLALVAWRNRQPKGQHT